MKLTANPVSRRFMFAGLRSSFGSVPSGAILSPAYRDLDLARRECLRAVFKHAHVLAEQLKRRQLVVELETHG